MSIKKLAGQTLWYGLSSIVGRFLNYFLSLLLVYYYSPDATAPVQQVYVIIPFLNILFTLGLETSYFRFSSSIEKQKLFNTLSSFITLTTIAFTALLVVFYKPVVAWMEMERHIPFYFLTLGIVFIDTLCALPFAKLRQENRPRKFAVIKFMSIIVNVVLVVFFLIIAPRMKSHGIVLPEWLYHPSFGIGYYILANVIASLATFIMLLPEWKGYRLNLDTAMIQTIMRYSAPILIVGFGGMINDFLSRVVYYKVLHNPISQLDHEFGVFAANYKLAVLATLFIQVFRMGAEPFFFNQAKEKNAPETYARITKLFVIVCCFIFLSIAMNLDIWVLLIASGHKAYAEGIGIVPVLTLANIFLGIYYNLSVWYKLKDQTMKGAIITLAGVGITILLNMLLIPSLHYVGASWATLGCYSFMMVVSYFWGQKHYPIPYDVKRCLFYLGFCVAMYLGFSWLKESMNWSQKWIHLSLYTVSMILFTMLIVRMDRDELKQLPFIQRWIR